MLLPQIKAGALRPIALGAPSARPTAPDVPTTAEVGMPDLLIENWYGMVAPGARREKIVATLNRIANEAMADPAVKEKLAEQGAYRGRRYVRSISAASSTAEIKKWAKVIKDAGVETAK